MRVALPRRLRASAWLLGPLAAGAFLRLFRLSTQVLYGDELHAVRAALALPLARILTTYRPSDNCIPLTALDRLWLDAGGALSEWVVRLPPLVAGLLFVVLAPRAVERRLGQRTALPFAWLVALAPGLVFYSRIARSYMPVVLTGFAAVLALERFVREGRARWAAGYVAAAALSVWLHLGAAPFVAAPLLWAVALRLRERRGPSLAALAGVGLGLAVGLGAFLGPAWSSFRRLVATKAGAFRPDLPRLGEVLALQAGTVRPWAAVLFWALAAAGLTLLARRRPRLALLSALLWATQAVALWLLAPVGIAAPLIFNRYLLIALPWLLLGVAAALAWTAEAAGRAAAVALVALLVLGGPLPEPRLRWTSFAASDDVAGFAVPPPRMISPQLVPGFYRRLAAEPGDGAVIEATGLPTWTHVTPLRIYQDVHRRRVLFAPGEEALFTPRTAFRTLVEPTPAAFLSAPARYLVVHRRSPWEIDRVVTASGRDLLPVPPPTRRSARLRMRRLARLLERRWGPPDHVEARLEVWDLDRIRGRREEAATAPGGRR